MVFVEGTVLMHKGGAEVSRGERVKQSHEAGMQKEEVFRKLNDKTGYVAPAGSVHDYSSYIPVGGAIRKIQRWRNQGATIYYLSSRRVSYELDAIKQVLMRNGFPDWQNLVFRQQEETYQNVVERIMPDVLIEDDCESIGGESEMIYPNLRTDMKKKIKSLLVKEFAGIDDLADDLSNIEL